MEDGQAGARHAAKALEADGAAQLRDVVAEHFAKAARLRKSRCMSMIRSAQCTGAV
jgi:hypothetical protein